MVEMQLELAALRDCDNVDNPILNLDGRLQGS